MIFKKFIVFLSIYLQFTFDGVPLSSEESLEIAKSRSSTDYYPLDLLNSLSLTVVPIHPLLSPNANLDSLESPEMSEPLSFERRDSFAPDADGCLTVEINNPPSSSVKSKNIIVIIFIR